MTPTAVRPAAVHGALSAARAAALPRVNLLPREVVERQQFRKVQVGLGAGVGLVTALVLATYAASTGQVSDAREDLAVATARTAQLQSDQHAYANAPAVEAKLQAETALVAQAMGQDVRWSRYLHDIAVLMPSGVWLTDLSIAQTGSGAAAADATATAAAAPAGVATITFSGKATSQDAVAGWLDALGTEPEFTDAYFTDSTSAEDAEFGRDVVTFSSTVTVTSEALSHRYDSTGS